MLEATREMGGFILDVDGDARQTRGGHRNQMRIGRACDIRINLLDCTNYPISTSHDCAPVYNELPIDILYSGSLTLWPGIAQESPSRRQWTTPAMRHRMASAIRRPPADRRGEHRSADRSFCPGFDL